MEITIGTLTAKSGEKVQGYYEGDGFKIPVTIICGNKEGETLLLSGGFHGSEYDGIKVCMELANELEPSDISGCLIIASLINQNGFFNRRAEQNPTDKTNIYASFPGKKDGTESERICYCFEQDFMKKADYFVDLHGGNMYEKVAVFTYYAPAESVREKSQEMARAVNSKYMAMGHMESGAVSYAGRELNIPAIVIERGGFGALNFRNVKIYKKDVLNVMKTIGMVKGRPDRYRPFNIEEVEFVFAEDNGCYMECFSAGDYIKKDDVLAYVTDVFGNTIKTYKAEYDGVILCQIDTFACQEKKLLYTIGKVRAI
ncbi:MAG: succinylglutamate desuccinylase/aspartoacylase family protein [Clostridia bacterium]|nr:succinylglutamate desuccinylase/aspartoacylase family protein [Clostridia bacterium]